MEEKNCTRCGVSQPLDSEHFGKRKTKTGQSWRWDSWCRLCYATNTRRINTLNPELKNRRDREWRERNADAVNERRRQRLLALSFTEKERMKAHHRKHNNKLKREAMEHYGGAFCHCCGETELLMLALDHIESDGAAHRKSLMGNTRTMPTVSYIWAKRNNWPPIYQVSCHNCNFARHWSADKRCPHEIARQSLTVVTPAYQAA